jgi:CRP/FNR family transcriptional regulator
MIRELPSLVPGATIDILKASCARAACTSFACRWGSTTTIWSGWTDHRPPPQGGARRHPVPHRRPFQNLYAIRLGHFKTYQVNRDGAEQITGFQMAGELLGMDAISADQHHCTAVALEDSEVCEIPFASLQQLLAEMPTLLRHFHRMMSQEITREQSVMLLLGNMQATQRFAAFLVNLSSRYEARGYSPTTFQLRMSREEIGNYLGLTIESISRLLSKFKKEGLVRVSNREIELLDPRMLKAITAGTATCA